MFLILNLSVFYEKKQIVLIQFHPLWTNTLRDALVPHGEMDHTIPQTKSPSDFIIGGLFNAKNINSKIF
jgi:hypothetical protein